MRGTVDERRSDSACSDARRAQNSGRLNRPVDDDQQPVSIDQ